MWGDTLCTCPETHVFSGLLRRPEHTPRATNASITSPLLSFHLSYSLQRDSFFSNLGPIMLFAVAGTCISAVVVALGLYHMGEAGWIYPLSYIER